MRRCRQGEQLKSFPTFQCGPGHPVPSQEQDRDAAAPALLSYSCLQLDQVKLRTAFALGVSLANDCKDDEAEGGVFLFYFFLLSLQCDAQRAACDGD